MIKLFSDWFNRNFSDPQVVILSFLLIVLFGVVLLFGDIMLPLLAAIIIAYLLDGPIAYLESKKFPHILAVVAAFSAFLLVLLSALFILAPLMVRQASQFVLEIPKMLGEGQRLMMTLPEKYPNILSEKQILEMLNGVRTQVADLSHQVVSFSLASVSDMITFMVYLILVPILVFFFLKDKKSILGWFKQFLPNDMGLASVVWNEVNIKTASYVRGKITEIIIIWFVTLATFLWFGLDYAILLSFLVGISVLVPYVGAAVVTLPVAIVAYFQWGIEYNFAYVMIAYAIIQFLDGNLLVPLLFSEMVNLHPAAIIAAVLFFGGLWGIWGVFFAIPLATLVNAVINAWPSVKNSATA